MALTSPTHIDINAINICMRAQDFVPLSQRSLKTFVVKIKLRQRGYTNVVDTQVQARTAEMARRILRAQYNNPNVIIGQPRELRTR